MGPSRKHQIAKNPFLQSGCGRLRCPIVMSFSLVWTEGCNGLKKWWLQWLQGTSILVGMFGGFLCFFLSSCFVSCSRNLPARTTLCFRISVGALIRACTSPAEKQGPLNTTTNTHCKNKKKQQSPWDYCSLNFPSAVTDVLTWIFLISPSLAIHLSIRPMGSSHPLIVGIPSPMTCKGGIRGREQEWPACWCQQHCATMSNILT